MAQLVEHLRRFVDDQAHLENRRILDLVREIEAHAIHLKGDVPREPAFAQIDAIAPELELPMCRGLYSPARNPVLAMDAVEEGEAELDLAALFAQTVVDERRLRGNIYTLLRERNQVTLSEVASAFPPEQGLAEVVAYLRIAGEDGAAVDESIKETLLLTAASGKHKKRVQVPRIIFST